MPLLTNTTGRSEPEKYVLGRGRAYLAVLSSNRPDDNGWRFLGNARDFSLNIAEEVLKHYNTQTGLKRVDREVTLSQELTGSFTLEEFNMDNLADLMRGVKATHTNSAIAGFAKGLLVTDVKLGRWYDIVDPTVGATYGERAYDIDSTKLTLEFGAQALDSTDFELDAEMGRIFFLSTATHLSDGDQVDITLTADAGASVVQEMQGLNTEDVDCALKFVLENAADANAQSEWQFHLVKLKANGDIGLISDDWAGMPFTFTAEENSTLGGTDSPVFTVRSHALA